MYINLLYPVMLCGVGTEVVFRGEGQHMNTEVVEGKPERRARAAGSVWHGQPVQIGRKVKLGLGEKVKVSLKVKVSITVRV